MQNIFIVICFLLCNAIRIHKELFIYGDDIVSGTNHADILIVPTEYENPVSYSREIFCIFIKFEIFAIFPQINRAHYDFLIAPQKVFHGFLITESKIRYNAVISHVADLCVFALCDSRIITGFKDFKRRFFIVFSKICCPQPYLNS